jgi:zinc/manganese transport system substrate-binding protein
LPLLVLAAVVLGACGDPRASDSESTDGASLESVSAEAPTVIATTTIWADVVANVACTGEVEVATVIPPGADPHSYEPSIADRQAMDEADLLVANGLSLEEGLTDTLDEVEAGGTPVFYVGEHIETIAYGAHSADGDEGDEHDEHDGHDDEQHEQDGGNEGGQDEGERAEHDHHGGGDPHVWFDPVRVAAMLPDLGDALASATGLDPAMVADCVTEYQKELEAVDAEITDIVGAIPLADRELVTNHDGFGYFADRYRFEVIGTVIPSSSTLAEANPAQLERLARSMRDAGVKAVFAETQQSTEEAEALATLAGDVEVVTLLSGTLASPDDDADNGAESYIGLLRTNATRIADALT